MNEKWVTYYYSILGGITDLTVHDDKSAAAKFFKKHYRDYFIINTPMRVKLPCTYGFPHRKYCATTKSVFEKEFGSVEMNGGKE